MTAFPSMTLDARPRPASQTHSRLLNHEAVIVRPDRGEIKVLNDVGARVWALSDGAHSVRDIVAMVCAEYDVTRDAAEADVLAFMIELQSKGLITI